MQERFADVGDGITLCYETFGTPRDPTVLLIMGLGMQMLGWDERFCRALAARGFHVIRYDNRDAGRSTAFDDVPPPSPLELLTRRIRRPAYLVSDMARDAVGLLDALGRPDAHVVGASMGGMIAQTVAARHPEHVRSLTSIMSNTGARRSGQPTLRTYPVLLGRTVANRDEYIARSMRVFELIGSPGFEHDEDELRATAGIAFDRAYRPAGSGRQLGAIIASGDRRPELRAIRAPTLVIHGSADRLVRSSGGRATARAIAGARLMMIPGMGHDLPRAAWPQLLDAIDRHARTADRERDASRRSGPADRAGASASPRSAPAATRTEAAG
jgi:pimeloyl-ACP methyl ester carboxylesterase